MMGCVGYKPGGARAHASPLRPSEGNWVTTGSRKS